MNIARFTQETVQRLEKRYKEAIKNKEEHFSFEGNELVTSYAKYLIEYCKTRLGK